MDEDVKLFKSKAWRSSSVAANYRGAVNDSYDYQKWLADYWIDGILRSHPDKNSRILDVACGTGVLFSALAKRGYYVDGIDISSEMLAQIDMSGLHSRCSLYQGDIFNLGNFSELGDYDAAVSRWFLPHFKDWKSILVAVGGLLKSGGKFYFDFPYKPNYEVAKVEYDFSYDNFPYDEREVAPMGHNKFYAAYTRRELQESASSAGFDLASAQPLSFFYVNPIFCQNGVSDALYKRFRGAMDQLIRSDEGKYFFDYFERFVTPRMPRNFSNLHQIILVKR